MKRFFQSANAKFGVISSAFVATAATAAPITVDLTDASTSVTNAGNSMIGVYVIILSFAIVLGFIKRR